MNDIAIPERLVRSEYLGSSDAAAILGLSKWKTPLDVWRAKVFPDAVEDEAAADRSKILRRGTLWLLRHGSAARARHPIRSGVTHDHH